MRRIALAVFTKTPLQVHPGGALKPIIIDLL